MTESRAYREGYSDALKCAAPRAVWYGAVRRNARGILQRIQTPMTKDDSADYAAGWQTGWKTPAAQSRFARIHASE